MVKNIINIFIFFILCIYNMGLQSHAFIGEETWLNLYNIIDEWYEKIDEQNFIYELSWADDTIKDKVNVLITQEYENSDQKVENCIQWDLAPSHIKEIAFWNTKILFDKLWDSCKNSSNSVDIDTLQKIQNIIYKHYIKTKNIADEKSHQIQKIGSVWLYTDGILENSSFDLIDDIEKIDSIIFTQKIHYEWEEYEDLNKLFEEKQEDKKEIINNKTTDLDVISENNWESIAASSIWTSQWNQTNVNNLNILENFNSPDSYYWSSSSYVCVEWWDHWFNPQVIDDLLQWNEENSPWNNNSNNSPNTNNNSNSNNNQSNNWNNNSNNWWTANWGSQGTKTPESISGNYEKLNDNAVWPCSNFFCITVDFVVHQHQLLWWGENITIEYLIDRSNQHLRKFANASLAPAKMTTQNFELWLKDLNLSEMFHMSFQVSTKPVPILNVNKNNRDEPNEYSSNILIEKYYKANNLDYKRRNDIDVMLWTQKEYKTLLNSVNLDKSVVIKKQNLLESYEKLQTLKRKQISDNIYKKVTYETLWDFGTQFTELNNFTTEIRNYTEKLSDIVNAMIKIPIDW